MYQLKLDHLNHVPRSNMDMKMDYQYRAVEKCHLCYALLAETQNLIVLKCHWTEKQCMSLSAAVEPLANYFQCKLFPFMMHTILKQNTKYFCVHSHEYFFLRKIQM